MVYRHVPALRARFLQTSAMVLLAAAPQALAQTPVCDDTVLPIPAGCERATAGNVLAIPVAPNVESDAPGNFGATGFSISLDDAVIAGAEPPRIPERGADIALARFDVDVTFDGLDNRRLLNVSTVDQATAFLSLIHI